MSQEKIKEEINNPSENADKGPQAKRSLESFRDIAEFLDGLNDDKPPKKSDIYKGLNNALMNGLNREDELATISCEDRNNSFTENDHSLETFLRRIVLEYIQTKSSEMGCEISLNEFDKTEGDGKFSYSKDAISYDKWNIFPIFLKSDTTKTIFEACKVKLFKDNNNIDEIDENVLRYIADLCQHTQKNQESEKNEILPQENQGSEKNEIFPIFPLDFIMYSISKSCNLDKENNIKAIFPFIDMGNFCYDKQQLSKEEIYEFFWQTPSDCLNMFLENRQFVDKLGGSKQLKNLLAIENLEKSDNKNAQDLARMLRDRCQKIDFSQINAAENDKTTGIKVVDDEAYKAKVKRAFMIHQLPKSVASAIVFLFGVGLLFATGFAWSVPFLLGIGFLIPSIAAFTNSILCMNPTEIKTWLAKVCKNCAWIIDGALLITLGAVFCAGPLAIAFMTFGSLGILMGCFNAFVGTLNSMWDTQRELVDCEKADQTVVNGGVNEINDIKSEILSHKIFNLVVFAIACAAGVLLALNPAILPIALPFLPAVGIGIAILSGLGVIKSALRLFYDNNNWQVGFYHAAKYIKAGMFVLGGLGLIALPFLPIASALASVIGMPTLIINIFSLLVGLFSAIKGCMSFRRMSSNIKFILSYRAMEKAYLIYLPEVPIDIESWKNDLRCNNKPLEPKLKPGDISMFYMVINH